MVYNDADGAPNYALAPDGRMIGSYEILFRRPITKDITLVLGPLVSRSADLYSRIQSTIKSKKWGTIPNTIHLLS
jgi:hypothetical protein